MATNTSDTTKKLIELIQSVIKAEMVDLKKHITVTGQNQELALDEIKAKLNHMEGLVASKAASKKKKDDETPAATTPATDAPGAPAAGDANATQAPAAPQAFPGTKLLWFKKQYEASADFRARFMNDQIKALVDADESIKKKKDDQKLLAEAGVVYKWINDNDAKGKGVEITNEYAAKKKEHEAAKTTV